MGFNKKKSLSMISCLVGNLAYLGLHLLALCGSLVGTTQVRFHYNTSDVASCWDM